MTLVAGFTGRDGIVLCADNESLYGDYSKKRVEKIKWGRKNRADFSYAIAAATDSEEYVQMVESDLQFGVMERFEVYEPEKIHEAIKRYLHEFHLQHVWPRTDSAAAPRIHTLIVLHPDSSARAYPLLLHTTETAVNIVHDPYCCIGVGAHLANFILGRLVPNHGGRKAHLLSTAVYLLKQVHENITGIGPGTDVYYFENKGPMEILREDSEQFKAIRDRSEPLDQAWGNIFEFMTDVSASHWDEEENFIELSQEIKEQRSAMREIFRKAQEQQEQTKKKMEEYRRAHPKMGTDDIPF